MGNWRTVNIIGTCAASELDALRKACEPGQEFENFHCLSVTPSICGLNDWPAEKMNCVGNLSERDYSVKQVAETLRKLVAVAPSLKLKVHCGEEYENNTCVGTITVENGTVIMGEAELRYVTEISKDSMQSNFRKVYQKSFRE